MDVVLVLHVDDLLIASNCRPVLDKMKSEFAKRFKMKDFGVASEFLAIIICRCRATRTLCLSQEDYITKVLHRFVMQDAKATATPMEVLSAKMKDDPEDLIDAIDVPYRQAIGSLMYLMICTRPDIAYAVGRLSQFCENPLKSHWKAVKRVLRYVKGTRSRGIVFRPTENLTLTGYADSDWAGCADSLKSTEGYIFLLSGGAIAWRSKKQSVFATSSCEAEYIATCSARKQAI